MIAVDHQRAGRAAAAGAIYREVLQAEPGQPQALYLHGLLDLAAGRADRAASLLARAVEVRPSHTGARLALARARLEVGQKNGAVDAAESALALDPNQPEAHFLLGTALSALGRTEEAIASLVQAVARQPRHAAAHLNLGNAWADLDRFDEAERFCRAAITLDPALAEAHASLGFILTATGRLDDAVAACDAAIALRPDFAEAHWNRAVACLLAGDFAAGFAGCEWRKRHRRFHGGFPDLPGPSWMGEDLAGRTILVRAEQGLGDAIQLSRYLPRLVALGARVELVCDARLIPLLRTLPASPALTPQGMGLPRYDVWVDQMSLPRLFATTPETVPTPSGYLQADPAWAAAWRATLPEGCRVGLVWAGNPAHANDRRRSLPPGALAPLLEVPGQCFVSLQLGPRSVEAAAMPGLIDPTARLTDYAATAALVAALDLVITVDTSVAHLAGALGRPVWVMLPFAPDWRWMLGRDNSPWYSSMRLFRQERPGHWSGVVASVAETLRNAPPRAA
ncbi:MAG: tetratricopeptide repeat protein [Alphaproteobacteria bacterium]|nr:tetratricopeptide repeat protein [Alphaproteobacteria bacterium]